MIVEAAKGGVASVNLMLDVGESVKAASVDIFVAVQPPAVAGSLPYRTTIWSSLAT